MLKIGKRAGFISLAILSAVAAYGQGPLSKLHVSDKFSVVQGDVTAKPIANRLSRVGCISLNTKTKSAPVLTLKTTGSTSISMSEVDVYGPPGDKPIIVQIANVDINKTAVITSGFITFTLNAAEWAEFAGEGKLYIFNKELDYIDVKPQRDAAEQCLQHR